MRDRLGLTFGRAHHSLQRILGKPTLHVAFEGIQIEVARSVLGGQMDGVPDPVQIHSRFGTAVL